MTSQEKEGMNRQKRGTHLAGVMARGKMSTGPLRTCPFDFGAGACIIDISGVATKKNVERKREKRKQEEETKAGGTRAWRDRG